MSTSASGESLSIAAVVAAVLAAALPASSHAAPANGGAQADDTVENVMVTARRREEAVQDVPLAIAVLNAGTIESTGTFNVGKLSQLQPSVQFYSSNPRNSAVNIRGL